MPYADPEKRRAKMQEWYSRNPDYQKEQYAKHRAKRLAAKAAAYAAEPEKMRARNKESYAKFAEKRAAEQRAYRAANREKTNKEARESYHRNKAKRRKTKLAYYKKNYDKIYSYIQDWRKRNPERELLYHAKRLLNEAVVIRIAEIPQDLAIAKAEQIKVLRAAKAMSASGQDQNGLGAQPASAVGETDLP